MARRRQTTGQPRTRKPEQTETPPSRRFPIRPLQEYRTRAEREAAIQRLVLLGVGGAVGLIVLIVAIALIYDQFIVPSRVVATVNSEDISVSDYRSRVRLERLVNIERINAQINDFMEFGMSFEEAGNQTLSIPEYGNLWQELEIPDQLGLRVLNDMVNDHLIRAEAEQMGVTVTQEDIDRQFRQVFGFDPEAVADEPEAEITPEVEEEPTPTRTPFVSPTPSPEPSPTSTPEAEPTETQTPFPTVPPPPTLSADERQQIFESGREDFYDRARRAAGLSREEVDRYFEMRALRAAISREVLEADDTEVWVNVRHILVETEDEALDVIDALNAGESFASLARAVSQDPGSGAQGGELNWGPAAQYIEPFAEAVREAEIGQIVGPVVTEFGYHVIQVRGREDRETDEFLLEFRRDEVLSEWVSELRQREENEVSLSNIWPDFVPTDPAFQFRER
jgi:peptidyl-prolyl cis-trans isomerase D